MTRRVCVVVTAWPSYPRIKSALEKIMEHSQLELQVVVGASALTYQDGHLIDVIERDGFKIDGRVFNDLEEKSPIAAAKTTGFGLVELTSVFDNLRPDAVVTIGDRYETLATAIAASYMNIPLVHVQGGEVTGSIDEKIRHAVTKLSNLHMVATELAQERLVRMGEDPESVFITGCPSIDLANEILSNPSLDFDPLQKYKSIGAPLRLADGYIVVVQHPVFTEYRNARVQVTETLRAVGDLGLPTLWFWPNADAGTDGILAGIQDFRLEDRSAKIRFFENMEPTDFLRLLYNSRCVVGNSSVAIRECSFLGVPAVNIGTRQTRRERGCNVVDVAYNRNQIKKAVQQQVRTDRLPRDQTYGDGQAGEKIAQLLATVPLTIEKRLHY